MGSAIDRMNKLEDGWNVVRNHRILHKGEGIQNSHAKQKNYTQKNQKPNKYKANTPCGTSMRDWQLLIMLMYLCQMYKHSSLSGPRRVLKLR